MTLRKKISRIVDYRHVFMCSIPVWSMTITAIFTPKPARASLTELADTARTGRVAGAERGV